MFLSNFISGITFSVGDSLYNFFIRFLHPFKAYTFLSKEEKHRHIRAVMDMDKDKDKNKDSFQRLSPSNFVEVTSISWALVIIQAIISLLAMNFGFHAFKMLGGFESLSIPMLSVQNSSFLFLLANIVFFPLFSWIYVRFWSFFINFFLSLYNLKRDDETVAEVIYSSFSANTFLLVPVFGPFCRGLAMLFFLFAGLKCHLQMTVSQSLFVLFSPILFFFIFFMVTLILTLMVLAHVF